MSIAHAGHVKVNHHTWFMSRLLELGTEHKISLCESLLGRVMLQIILKTAPLSSLTIALIFLAKDLQSLMKVLHSLTTV